MRIIIIGAGFAGLGAAVKVKEAGFAAITVLEQANDVGGTWLANTYPGCACDIQSNLYSFSFEPNPHWTRTYPRQPEILAYLQHVAHKYAIRPLIRFNTEVTEARWDDAANVWNVHTATGDIHTAEILINGTGPLSRPKNPDVVGLDRFQGTLFHSARWNHHHSLSGERVAVIGTGASAIQFVPEIAPDTAQTYVFQRTAPWVVPRNDRPFTAKETRLFTRFPIVQRAYRAKIWLRAEMFGLALLGNQRVSKQISDGGTQFIRALVTDPELQVKVTPHFAPGCKRLLISNDWYPALTQPNVELVTEPITEVRAHSVITADGTERTVDTIVLATGFAATEFLAPMKIFGRTSRELSEAWQDGAQTHFGISVSEFPNLFIMVGPSTGLGHNSIVFMMEAQLHWIVGALKHLRSRGAKSVDVRPNVQATSYADIQQRMKKTVWLTGCSSWYRSADGRVDTLWPGLTWEYWLRTRRFRVRQYCVTK